MQRIKLGQCFPSARLNDWGCSTELLKVFLLETFGTTFWVFSIPRSKRKALCLFKAQVAFPALRFWTLKFASQTTTLFFPLLLEFFGFWVGGTKIGKRIWIPPHPPLTCKIPNVTLIELHQFGLCFYCKQRLEKRPETLNLTNEVSHTKLKRHALKKRMKAKHFAWNIRFTSSDSFLKTILSKQIKVFWFARKLSNNFQTVSTLLS